MNGFIFILKHQILVFISYYYYICHFETTWHGLGY